MRPGSGFAPLNFLPPAPASTRRLVSLEALAEAPRPRVVLSLLTAGLEVELFAAASYAAAHSLLGSDALEEASCSLVVFDNGSAGGRWFLNLLEEMGAAVIRHGSNVGIAGGRNKVAAAAFSGTGGQFDFLLELHTDHIFPRAWLAPLLRAMDDTPRLGAVGPGLITASGAFGTPRLAVDYRATIPDLLKATNAACEAARGKYAAALPRLRRGMSHPILKRREALEEVGLYDEARYPLQNFEDTDEARRLETAGWQVAVCLDSWVFHHYALSRTSLGDHVWAFRENYRAFRARWPDSAEWLREWDRAIHGVYRL